SGCIWRVTTRRCRIGHVLPQIDHQLYLFQYPSQLEVNLTRHSGGFFFRRITHLGTVIPVVCATDRSANGNGVDCLDVIRCCGGSVADRVGSLREFSTSRTYRIILGVLYREPGDVGLCPHRGASRHRVCGVGGYRGCTRGDRLGGPRRRAPIVDQVWTTGHTHRLGAWRAGDELMAWLVLRVSAVLEAVWATALGASDGLTRVVPAVVFLI